MKFMSTSNTITFEVEETLLFIGAVLVPTVFVLIWALFFKKKRKRKYKHHAKDNHRMNPTLAQTGGLPPQRKAQNVTEQSKT